MLKKMGTFIDSHRQPERTPGRVFVRELDLKYTWLSGRQGKN
jgi:hypothetical protein